MVTGQTATGATPTVAAPAVVQQAVVQRADMAVLLARFRMAVAHQYKVRRVDEGAIEIVRRNQETALVQPRGKAALGADEKTLSVSPSNKFGKQCP